jgi:hypothetical protein
MADEPAGAPAAESAPTAEPSSDAVERAHQAELKLARAEAKLEQLEALRAANAESNPGAPTYRSPDGASGPPAEAYETDARKWNADSITRMIEDGLFIQRLNRYRNSLPGGSDGIFRKKIPTAR